MPTDVLLVCEGVARGRTQDTCPGCDFLGGTWRGWGEGNKMIRETPQVTGKGSQPGCSETRGRRTEERRLHKEPPNSVSVSPTAVSVIRKPCRSQERIPGRDGVPRQNVLMLIFLFSEPEGAGKGAGGDSAGNYSFPF